MDSLQPQLRTTTPRPAPWRKPLDHRRTPVIPLLSESDLHAMRHGMHCLMYTVMGAHPDVRDGVAGTRFAVWAPNAQEVAVACDANSWQHGRDPLTRIDDGIWTGFVPGLRHGGTYKFSLRDSIGHVQQKADPFAFAAELRPKSASIVYDLGNYRWRDQPWLRR